MKTRAFIVRILLLGACALGPHAFAQRADADCGARKIPQLTDVTAKSGVRFTHTSAPEKKYIVESMSGGVLLLDYDRDGWLDIYLTNAPTVEMALKGQKARSALYRNNRDGTFTDVTDKAGLGFPGFAMGGAAGDFDNDGFADIYVTCLGGNVLYRNNGDGTFADVTKRAGVSDGRWSAGAAWADFDSDGFLDLMVTNYVDFRLNDLPGFGSSPACKLLGLESGTGVSGDGSEQGSMGVAVGDYMHTGRFSVFVTNFADEYNTLYRNNGDYDFTDVSVAAGVAQVSRPYVGWGTGFFDVDNDGWLDLLVANGHVYPQIDTLPSGARYRQSKLLHVNLGNGSFCDASRQAGAALQEPRASRGAAFGDLDNDGHVDVVVNDLDGPPMILRNEGGDGNRWVTLELAATKGSPLAIGARVRVVTGETAQTEEVRSGGSYLSQNDLRLHFGLGRAAKVDLVEIRWPSGKVEQIKDLAADKFYVVLEGAGVVPPERIRPQAKTTK